MRIFFIIIISFFILGCTNNTKVRNNINSIINENLINIKNISSGLPEKGLWRQNIVLLDITNDGFPEIITPPPRKASSEMLYPHIFTYNSLKTKWVELKYQFPQDIPYNYGTIAIEDFNKDGYFDMIFAFHEKGLWLLINNKKKGFSSLKFPTKEKFLSRTVKGVDLNKDGYSDIVAFSEWGFISKNGYIPQGVLIGINDKGNGWKVNIIKDTYKIQGDDIDVGDIDGDGILDIVIAPLMAPAKYQKLIIFLDKEIKVKKIFNGAKLLNIKKDQPYVYKDRFIADSVSASDIDGDGIDEVVYRLSGFGTTAKIKLIAFKWKKNELEKFLEFPLYKDEEPLKFETINIDNDKEEEIFLISKKPFNIDNNKKEGILKGFISIFKYDKNIKKLKRIFSYEMDYKKDIQGVYGISVKKIEKSKFLLVYNRGKENAEYSGIKAFIIEVKK